MSDQTTQNVPLNQGLLTPTGIVQSIRQEAYMFYLIQYDKSFKFSQRSEDFVAHWDKTYREVIPPGVGCDFILGVFSILCLLLKRPTTCEADREFSNGIFTLCGQVIVALHRRGFFIEGFTKAEKANLELAGQLLVETTLQQRKAK